MSLSETQIFGFSENVQELFEKERKALLAAGFDVDEMLKILKQLHDETVEINAKQESLKAQLRSTTISLRRKLRKLYNLSSGYIDAAMTAVERSSPAAKVIRRLRSRIRRKDLEDSPQEQPESARPVRGPEMTAEQP